MEKEKKTLIIFEGLELYHQKSLEEINKTIQETLTNLVSFSEDKTFEGLEEVT